MRLIPRTRGGALLRFSMAALIVVAFTASATAVAGLLQFKQIAHYFNATPALNHAQVTIANPGIPQTLLLIGSDHRAGTSWATANTDTMMLVHIDPNSSTINLLSVPRDLRVMIPQGHVVAPGKLNSAYSIGGPNLLVRILTHQVLPGLQINHIIDVNFGGFESLVNAIGCVYTDVDHRYYNNTVYTNYSSIDIQPGYQKLCGPDALAFVRFRHTDTDIVRNARQQDFLRWVKGQFGEGDLIGQKNKLLSIFGQHTQTDPDLHSVDGLINLFDLVAFSAGHAVKQVPFPAILLPCNPTAAVGTGAQAQTPCYVSATPGALHKALQSFMATTTAARAAPAGGNGNRGASGHGPPPGPPKPAAVYGDFGDGKAQAGCAREPRDDGVRPARDRQRLPVLHERHLPDRAGRQFLSACLRDPRPARRPPPRLPHDAGHEPGARSVLRRAGDDLGEPADPEQPDEDPDRERQAADALHERGQDQPRRVADPPGRLLDLQRPHGRLVQPADGGDRGVAGAGGGLGGARPRRGSERYLSGT